MLRLRSILPLAGIVYRFGSWLANSRVAPTWNQDAEFRALRPGGE